MPKKALIFLALLAAVSFSSSQFIEKFERPWDTVYKWPLNSSIVDYSYSPPLHSGWNFYALQESVDALGIENCADHGQAGAVLGNYTKALETYKKMQEFTDYGMAPYIFDVAGVCGAVAPLWGETCSCKFSGYSAMECANLSKPVRYEIAKRIFSDEYSKAWKAAMNGAINALENQSSTLNQEMESLARDYETVNASGACDRQMSGFENCENALFFISAVNSNSTEAEYSGFLALKIALSKNEREVGATVPKIEFCPIIQTVSGEGGLLDKIAEVRKGLAEQENNTRNKYLSLVDEGNGAVAGADAAMVKASAMELSKISAGAAFGASVGNQNAPVGETAAKAEKNLNLAKEALKNAEISFNWKGQGYLKAAMANATIGNALAGQAENEFQTAASDGEAVAGNYEASARGWMEKVEKKFENSAWPQSAKALYESAEMEFGAGKGEDALGAKFKHYVNAINYASAAYAINPENEKDVNPVPLGMCERAEKLAGRAEADGIDVEYERAVVGVLKNSNSAGGALAGCSMAIDSIVSSAKFKYRDLAGMRAEVFGLIAQCGPDCDDLAKELGIAEVGVFSEGQIIYPDAIGSLGKLRQEYLIKKDDALDSLGLQAQNSVSATSSLFSEKAVLDGPSLSVLKVHAVNNADYPADSVKLEVASRIEFGAGDAKAGASELRGVAYSGGKLIIYIKRINASGKIDLEFVKETALLATKTTIKNTSGKEDFSAKIAEKRTVYAASDLDGFYGPYEWEAAYLDGVQMEIADGMVNARVSEGAHIVEGDYIVADAYERSIISNLSQQVGARIYYKYIVGITPKISMDVLETFAVLPSNEFVNKKQVITLTGEKIDASETSNGYAIKIKSVPAGRTAKFEVSYEVDNSAEYVEGELDKLKNLNVSPEIQTLMGQAQEALGMNQTLVAVDKLQQINEALKRAEVEQAKLAVECGKGIGLISSERDEIAGVLGNRVEGAFTDKLDARYEYLAGLLEEAGAKPAEECAKIVNKYDDGWLPAEIRAFRKNASLAMNGINVKYLDSGAADSNMGSSLADLRAAYDKFGASSSLWDAYSVAKAIATANEAWANLEKSMEQSNIRLVSDSEYLSQSLGDGLSKYNIERADARGSRFENVLDVDVDGAQKALKQIQVGVKNKDIKILKAYFLAANSSESEIRAGLSYLEGSAEQNLAQLEEAIASSQGMLSEQDVKEASGLLSDGQAYLNDGRIAKALKACDNGIALLANSKKSGNYDVVLWLSLGLVGAVIGVYYFKSRKREPPKSFRKLEKAV